MDNAMLQLALASAAFVVTHLGLSSAPLRAPLAARLGEKGFLGLYSIVALVTLIWMIHAYAGASQASYLWAPAPGLRHLPLLVVPLALILVAGGFTTRNPTAVGMEQALEREEAVRGILRITRHPVQWGILLWAAVHILANGDLASLLFFGGLLLVSLLGSLHIDRRMAASQGETWQRFAAVTSHVPFAAIIRGRQKLVVSELGLAVVLGLVLYAVMLWLHQPLFGVRPY